MTIGIKKSLPLKTIIKIYWRLFSEYFITLILTVEGARVKVIITK